MLLAGLSLLLMAPALLAPGTMSGDSFIHVRWQYFFAESLWQGNLYPRWLSAMNHGFGSPAFFIYPPLEQWLAALFWPLLPGGGFAPQRMMAGLALALALSGWGCMRWIRAMGAGRGAALVGAAAYLILPYHGYFNSYQRGALAELVAMAVLPFGFAYAHAMKARARLGWAGFALSIAAMLYSHAPTALFAVPITCGYALLLADRADRLALFLTTMAAALLGAGLAGAYLGTALTQAGAINGAVLFDGLYQTQNYLLLSAAPWPDTRIQMLVSAIVLLHLILLALLILLLRRSGAITRPVPFMIIACGLIFVAMTSVAHSVWAPHLPWSKIQFAWRMLSVQTLMLAGLTGLAWQAAGRPVWRAMLIGLLLLLAADIALFTARLLHSTSSSPVDGPAWPATLREEAAEYRLGDLAMLDRQFGAREAMVVDGRATIEGVRRRERGFDLAVDAISPATVAIRQFAYTGWEARLDGGAWNPAGRSAGRGGVATMIVLPGRHQVELRLTTQPGECLGKALSGLAILLLLAGIARDWRRKPLVSASERPISVEPSRSSLLKKVVRSGRKCLGCGRSPVESGSSI